MQTGASCTMSMFPTNCYNTDSHLFNDDRRIASEIDMQFTFILDGNNKTEPNQRIRIRPRSSYTLDKDENEINSVFQQANDDDMESMDENQQFEWIIITYCHTAHYRASTTVCGESCMMYLSMDSIQTIPILRYVIVYAFLGVDFMILAGNNTVMYPTPKDLQ
eukprot:219300_1